MRGHLESRRLREIFEAQRSCVRAQMDHYGGHVEQFTLGVRRGGAPPARGRCAFLAHRLKFDADLTELAHRGLLRGARGVEPVGLVYVWPDTN